jgi:two-component system, NtrC family, sensor histidine kinase HydH
LLNIILNAIEASPASSTITLRTEKRENQTACLCTDQGCGMTEEQIAQIFDPYVTHKPGGTGLGMSIVKRIIETHDGQIRVESKINQGTTVTFLFPHTAKPTE